MSSAQAQYGAFTTQVLPHTGADLALIAFLGICLVLTGVFILVARRWLR